MDPQGLPSARAAFGSPTGSTGTVSRIDPERGQVIKKIPVGFDPRGIAVGFKSVWVGLAGANSVVRIDPATDK
jgi:DNA-binding beta-propeller fold protein YncE